MPTLQQLHDRLDKLDEAISSGVSEVEFDGERIRYQSISAMRQVRRDILEQIRAKQGQRRTRVIQLIPSKGL